MEEQHRALLTKGYREHLRGKRIVCIDIPDKFPFMDPVLVAELKAKVEPLLRGA